MMVTWKKVPLGLVLTHRKEFVYIDDTTEYKRCRVRLHAQGIVLRDVVLGSQIRTKQQQVCRAGEFLVAEIDAKVGGYGIVPEDLDGAIVSSHYFLFVVDKAVLDPRFLDLYVRTPAFHEQVSARGSTNYAAIRPKHVLGYQVPLPPLSDQRRIQELAAKVEEVRRLQAETAAELDAILPSILNKAFQG
jgi:type I restriction enzyme, S subunit